MAAPKKPNSLGLTPGQAVSSKPPGSHGRGGDKRKDLGNPASAQPGFSDAERRRETAKAANQALRLQREAENLTQAAAGAGDPEERQRLLNEALNRSVEAESFGKTAKYLQTGMFQGMLAGAGIGVGTGIGLGTITGTLVGGVTGTIFGGLGGGVGTAIGAMHGPWFKVGDAMGAGIRKITGDGPKWGEGTEEQKYQLRKMVGQVKNQPRPTLDELQAMTAGDKADGAVRDLAGTRESTRGWGESAKALLPESWTTKKKIPEEQGYDFFKTDPPAESQGNAKKNARPDAKKADAPSKNSQDQGYDFFKPDPPPTKQGNTKQAGNANGKKADHQPKEQQAKDRDQTTSDKRPGSSDEQAPAAKKKKKPRKLQPKAQDNVNLANGEKTDGQGQSEKTTSRRTSAARLPAGNTDGNGAEKKPTPRKLERASRTRAS